MKMIAKIRTRNYEILPFIAHGQALIADSVFRTELATTMYTNGLLFQILQGIVVSEQGDGKRIDRNVNNQAG